VRVVHWAYDTFIHLFTLFRCTVVCRCICGCPERHLFYRWWNCCFTGTDLFVIYWYHRALAVCISLHRLRLRWYVRYYDARYIWWYFHFWKYICLFRPFSGIMFIVMTIEWSLGWCVTVVTYVTHLFIRLLLIDRWLLTLIPSPSICRPLRLPLGWWLLFCTTFVLFTALTVHSVSALNWFDTLYWYIWHFAVYHFDRFILRRTDILCLPFPSLFITCSFYICTDAATVISVWVWHCTFTTDALPAVGVHACIWRVRCRWCVAGCLLPTPTSVFVYLIWYIVTRTMAYVMTFDDMVRHLSTSGVTWFVIWHFGCCQFDYWRRLRLRRRTFIRGD